MQHPACCTLPLLQTIRPGQFMPGPIRESGLKKPLLIKGDRYNFNPHMGVALAGTGPSATDLSDRMDQEREVRDLGVLGLGAGPAHMCRTCAMHPQACCWGTKTALQIQHHTGVEQ